MKCDKCGSMMHSWDDLASAFEIALNAPDISIPNGMRPMILQAIDDLRRYRTALEKSAEGKYDAHGYQTDIALVALKRTDQ